MGNFRMVTAAGLGQQDSKMTVLGGVGALLDECPDLQSFEQVGLVLFWGWESIAPALDAAGMLIGGWATCVKAEMFWLEKEPLSKYLHAVYFTDKQMYLADRVVLPERLPTMGALASGEWRLPSRLVTSVPLSIKEWNAETWRSSVAKLFKQYKEVL